jgi:hypothetical protein
VAATSPGCCIDQRKGHDHTAEQVEAGQAVYIEHAPRIRLRGAGCFESVCWQCLQRIEEHYNKHVTATIWMSGSTGYFDRCQFPLSTASLSWISTRVCWNMVADRKIQAGDVSPNDGTISEHESIRRSTTCFIAFRFDRVEAVALDHLQA